MKYIFKFCNEHDGEIRLYSLEAESIEEANELFIAKLLPFTPNVDYSSFDRAMCELDVTVESLGPIDEIEEL
jgi:hypothetical protein